jgi:hypothetical protein
MTKKRRQSVSTTILYSNLFLPRLFIACNVVRLQLGKLGFDSEFLQCQIQVNDDKVWDGVRRKYWHGRDVYYLPRITWNDEFLGRKIKASQTSDHVEMEVEQSDTKRQRRVEG